MTHSKAILMHTDRKILNYCPTNPAHYITLEEPTNKCYQVCDYRKFEGEDYERQVYGTDSNRQGYHTYRGAFNYYLERLTLFPEAPRRYKLSELPQLGLLMVKGYAKHPIPNSKPLTHRPYTLVDTLFFELKDGTAGFCQCCTQ